MKESKYKKELAEFDVEKAYKTEEVMDMLKKQPKRNFTESVDVAVKLGIDPKKSDQNVRGSLTLPNSLGKSIVVAAFVEGDKAEEAKKAGADIAGGDEFIDRIKNGEINLFISAQNKINIEVGFTSSSPLSVDTYEDLEKIIMAFSEI